jgi:hypothetical protein
MEISAGAGLADLAMYMPGEDVVSARRPASAR